MSYKDTLFNAIEKSKLSLNEIAKRCKEYGVSITYSYISQLRSGKIPAPSNDVSKALAKVCDIDENILIIEAYLDKAPEIIQEFIKKVRYLENANFKNILNGDAPSDPDDIEWQIDIFKSYLDKQPLSEYIIEYIKRDDKDIINKELKEFDNLSDNDPDPDFISYISINDDAMEPIIQKDSMILLSDERNYVSGDILAYNIKASDEILIRKYLLNDDKITFIPINNKHEIKTYNVDDVFIIGKVKSIIEDI
ncbi:MAG TPA: XRE family transcriptional regulator [Patescibacteria group bacterium]|nr:XRE family transcriptional regulator [Patescibacteria group bacterium]